METVYRIISSFFISLITLCSINCQTKDTILLSLENELNLTVSYEPIYNYDLEKRWIFKSCFDTLDNGEIIIKNLPKSFAGFNQKDIYCTYKKNIKKRDSLINNAKQIGYIKKICVNKNIPNSKNKICDFSMPIILYNHEINSSLDKGYFINHFETWLSSRNEYSEKRINLKEEYGYLTIHNHVEKNSYTYLEFEKFSDFVDYLKNFLSGIDNNIYFLKIGESDNVYDYYEEVSVLKQY